MLGAAPDTFLGTAGQTARAAIDDGLIGTPFAATSFVRSTRVEAWHPNPGFFFQPGGGPALDMGPYHIAALVNLLGPIAEVAGATTAPTRSIALTGGREPIEVAVPTTATAILRTVSGALVTVLYSFDVWDTTLPQIEVYGTEGTLALPDPNHHDRAVLIKRREDTPLDRVPWPDTPWRELPPAIPPTRERSDLQVRGHGVSDLVDSLAGAPLRASGAVRAARAGGARGDRGRDAGRRRAADARRRRAARAGRALRLSRSRASNGSPSRTRSTRSMRSGLLQPERRGDRGRQPDGRTR